jgi:hypothetical protein
MSLLRLATRLVGGKETKKRRVLEQTLGVGNREETGHFEK